MLVIGGGIAGLRVAESAREAGFDGTLTMVTDEPLLPYDRPPLSKGMLTGATAVELTTLRSEEGFAELEIDLIRGTEAVALDRKARRVDLADGRSIAYDTLVVATGSSARMLPFPAPDGVHTIRNMNDSLGLARELSAGRRLVVVGAGFLGAEVAASAQHLGLHVTLLEAGPLPLGRVMGPEVGAACLRLHERHGVQVRCGVSVVGFEGTEGVSGVRLASGATVPADIVVVAVGNRPNTDWLLSSGLTLADGIVCDDQGRAQPDGSIYAVGDVAAWFDPQAGRPIRREDWTSASEQARAVGQLVAGRNPEEHRRLPYFWSDQYGGKIQLLGTITHRALHVISGDLDQDKFVGVYLDEQDRVRGALALGEPRLLARCRPLVLSGADVAAARALAASQRTARVGVDHRSHHMSKLT